MSKQLLRNTLLTLAIAGAAYPAVTVQAAKPDGKGGGGGDTTETTTSAAAPEFYRVELDAFARELRLHGINLVTGDATVPVYPTDVAVAGRTVAIDEAASAAATDFVSGEGAVVVPYDSLLDALVGTTPGGRAIAGAKNYEMKVVTGGGTASFSAYVLAAIKDVPPDQGFCPCSFAIYTEQLDQAQPGTTFCSATQGVATEEYLEAGYGKVDETGAASAVIMGSHSSASGEPLYQSSCYVRDLSVLVDGVETPNYLEGPFPVGNGDHAICVAEIEAREPACVP